MTVCFYVAYHTKSAGLIEVQVNGDGHSKYNTKIRHDCQYIDMGLKYPAIYFLVFLSPSRKMEGNNFSYVTTAFYLVLPNSSFTHHSTTDYT